MLLLSTGNTFQTWLQLNLLLENRKKCDQSIGLLFFRALSALPPVADCEEKWPLNAVLLSSASQQTSGHCLLYNLQLEPALSGSS